MSETIKFVYAPFLRLALRQPGKSVSNWFYTGTLEENSEIKITPMLARRGKNERMLGCWIEVTALDIEATADARARFMPNINKQFEAGFLCQSGGFIDGPFDYYCYPDHLPQRGMRIIHKLSGMSYWPGWITFVDEGWMSFQQKFLVVLPNPQGTVGIGS